MTDDTNPKQPPTNPQPSPSSPSYDSDEFKKAVREIFTEHQKANPPASSPTGNSQPVSSSNMPSSDLMAAIRSALKDDRESTSQSADFAALRKEFEELKVEFKKQGRRLFSIFD